MPATCRASCRTLSGVPAFALTRVAGAGFAAGVSDLAGVAVCFTGAGARLLDRAAGFGAGLLAARVLAAATGVRFATRAVAPFLLALLLFALPVPALRARAAGGFAFLFAAADDFDLVGIIPPVQFKKTADYISEGDAIH